MPQCASQGGEVTVEAVEVFVKGVVEVFVKGIVEVFVEVFLEMLQGRQSSSIVDLVGG